ncbi:MAG: hypothetical protein K6G42_02235 [Lachnospiraceae bacterium]|nr:hypothetical protein [Lachnospiraceae bacterium]
MGSEWNNKNSKLQQADRNIVVNVEKQQEAPQLQMGVAARPEEALGVVRKKKEMQQFAESEISKFNSRIEREADESGLKKEIENMSLRECLNILINDSKGKSKSCQKMQNSLKLLVLLQDHNNAALSIPGKEIVNYIDALDGAELASRDYQITHSKWFYLTGYGSKRYRISKRISSLVCRLRSEIAFGPQNSIEKKEEQRAAEQTEEDMNLIIETGAFTEKEAGEEIKNWLGEGAEYKEILKRMIKGKEEFKDKEKLLKYVENKNRLLLANKMTLSMICDEHLELTFRLPALKSRLSSYIGKRLDESPETKEKMYSEVEEFRGFIKKCLKEYWDENREFLEKAGHRKEILLASLEEDGDDDTLWKREEVKSLLTADITDEEFALRLEELVIQKNDNIEIVNELIRDKGYAKPVAESISKKICARLKSLLIFGAELDVAEQARRYLDLDKYCFTEELETERTIEAFEKSYNIPSVYRDAFIRFLCGKEDISEIRKGKIQNLSAKAYIFKERLDYGEELIKNSGIKKGKLTIEQWKDLDNLRKNFGLHSKKNIGKLFCNIVTRKDTGANTYKYSQYKNVYQPFAKRGAGFSGRILGDLFLGSSEITDILQADEIVYLKENLMGVLIVDDEMKKALEYSTTSEIRKIAEIMRRNITANKEKISALREARDCDRMVRRKVLLKLAVADADAGENAFDDILNKVRAEEAAQKAMRLEKKEIEDYLAEKKNDGDPGIRIRASKYRQRVKWLKRYENGRYSLVIRGLLARDDFYREMMERTQEEFEAWVGEELDGKLGDLCEAIRISTTGTAVKSIWIDRNLDLVYSGKVKGNVMFWKRELTRIEKDIADEKQIDGKTIAENLEKAGKNAFLELRKQKAEFDMPDVLSCADKIAKDCYEDASKLDILKSSDLIKEAIISELRRSRNKKTEVKEPDAAEKARQAREKAVREDIEKTSDAKEISRLRNDYFGLSHPGVMRILKAINENKSLVTIGTGDNVDLSRRSREVAENYIKERFSALGDDLSPMVVNCLVERNLNGSIDETIDRTPGIGRLIRGLGLKGHKRLNEYTNWLARVNHILSEPSPGEEPISEDEKNLLLVNIFRDSEGYRDKDSGALSMERKTIKGKKYKTFRRNYRLLNDFEQMKITYAPIEQERTGFARELRGLLATGIGLKDQNSKSPLSFETLTKKMTAYISYSDRLCSLSEELLKTNENYADLSEFAANETIMGLRAYYYKDMMHELDQAGEKAAAFDSEAWKTKLNECINDPVRMKYIGYSKGEEESETKNKESRLFGQVDGIEAIDKLIAGNAWRSQRKKYATLSPEQKELFAVALMLMEKSALGVDGGSNTVLLSENQKKSQTVPLINELQKYMRGEEYHFRIDYAQAYYKLTNYGNNSLNILTTKFSDTAFDKAFEFVEGIHNKMSAPDKEVLARAGNGEEILREAALLGKKNIDEVGRLREGSLDPEEVKKNLIRYAAEDAEELSKKIGWSRMVPGRLRSVKKEEDRRKKVLKRLESLDEWEMKRFVAVLQDRTALDKSLRDKEKRVNDDKRKELKLMLSEEDNNRVFSQFMTGEACLKALSSALGFRLNDKVRLDGTLNADNLESESYNRTGKVDWKLLDNAFKLLDEVKKENIATYAVRHAPDYIEYSGNEKAKAAYLTMKDQKDMGSEELVDFLKRQAESDASAGENSEAMIAMGGFRKLTPGQKKLFFKVLGRRDLLDLSKKNLYRNVYNATAERSFVNEKDRFRLIDEYIQTSLGGNEGVTLAENAYHDAMKSLLSTQVDDTADFKSVNNVKKVLAGEKYFLMQRDTAVDWKLFNRALQFVNRADYELRLREGNAELYRSSGELSRYGHISMDYSILRRNIHNTGNRFLRFGVQRAKQALPETLGEYKYSIFGSRIRINELVDAFDVITKIMPKRAGKVFAEITDEIFKGGTGEEKKWLSGKLRTNAVIFNPAGANKLTEAPRAYQKYSVTDYNHIRDSVNNILKNADIMNGGAKQIGEMLGRCVSAPMDVEAIAKKQEKKKKKDVLDEQVGEAFKVKHRYGDIRDSLVKWGKKYETFKNGHDAIITDCGLSNRESELIALAERVVIDKFADAMLNQGNALSGIRDAIDRSYRRAKEVKLTRLKDNAVSKLISQKKVKPGYVLTEEEIKSHKYWTEKDEELTEVDKVNAVQDAAKDFFGDIVRGIIGDENAEKLLSIAKGTVEFTDMLREKLVWASHIAGVAKVYTDSFKDIAECVRKKGSLSEAKERAGEEKTKETDRRTLEEGEKYLETDRQKDLVSDIVEHHKEMQKLSTEIADNIQDVSIAKDVLNAAIETGLIIAGASGAGAVPTKIVAGAVKAGADFALYVIRCIKDNKALEDHYKNSEQGKAEVASIVSNSKSMFGKKIDEQSAVKDNSVLDIICMGNGYEKTEELVEDTGMRMASSIAYSASNYNPVMETKIQAATVMVVLNMRDKIGKTDASTIAEIFDSMRAA